MLSLYVDQARWRSHLESVAAAVPGLVPVVKGNGYGFGNVRLAETAEQLGADTVAVGTYAEVEPVLEHFSGSVLVLSPWRPFEARALYSDRLVHTIGRLDDLAGIREAAQVSRPRVVLELVTSMRRHGFTARDLRAAGRHLDGLQVEGFALHLPMAHGSHLPEVERLMNDVVASGVDSRRVYVSHLDDAELASLRRSYADFEIRPRVGTRLWLGDRGALTPRATVLDVHAVQRGDEFGYRGRSAPKHGHLVIVSGGTAHGVGLEAPTAAATMRDRAVSLAKGGLDAAGFVRSPFTIGGKYRLFAEPPHMQASMLFLPNGTPAPAVGDEVDVRVRYTTTTFDRIQLV
jgi:alanine racemase